MLDEQTRVIMFWFTVGMMVVVVVVALLSLVRACTRGGADTSPLIISPEEVSLCQGGRSQFRVEGVLEDGAEIEWRTSGGTITGSGPLAAEFVADDDPVARPVFEMWRAADTLFHTVMLRAAGNRRVMEMVGNLLLICQIQQDWDSTTYRTVVDAQRDHQQMLEAVTGGDVDRAQDIMRGHVDRALAFAVETYERRYANGPHEGVPDFVVGATTPRGKNHQ